MERVANHSCSHPVPGFCFSVFEDLGVDERSIRSFSSKQAAVECGEVMPTHAGDDPPGAGAGIGFGVFPADG